MLNDGRSKQVLLGLRCSVFRTGVWVGAFNISAAAACTITGGKRRNRPWESCPFEAMFCEEGRTQGFPVLA